MVEVQNLHEAARQAVSLAARQHHGQLLAILIKDLRDFQLAEDSFQDAIESALIHWARNEMPTAPMAWLLQTARRKAIDRLRRAISLEKKSAEISYLMEIDQETSGDIEDSEIPDERLRLIFTCCHPALDPAASVALSLRTLCGLTTAEIARAYVVSEVTMAQRLVRAQQKISKAAIAYAVPEREQWRERLQAVLNTIYLTFNEGYAATAGQQRQRVDLCAEAIRLSRLLAELLPQEPEAKGLLALLLLTHARRKARQSIDNAYIPLDQQNREVWDQPMIAEGDLILLQALRMNAIGPYQLQAAISAVHAQARTSEQTQWDEIVALYDHLFATTANPIHRLNRAVAISHLHGPINGLAEIAEISDELADYQPFHAARAYMLRRAGQTHAAEAAYEQAIKLSKNEAEKCFLRQQQTNIATPT